MRLGSLLGVFLAVSHVSAKGSKGSKSAKGSQSKRLRHKHGKVSAASFDEFVSRGGDEIDALFSISRAAEGQMMSMSMPPVSPTSAPVVITPGTPAPTGAPRDDVILEKCAVTGLERSRDILSELSLISDPGALLTPGTPQFQARDWLDNRDGAIICANQPEHIQQRYRVALLYFSLGGPSWFNCKAVADITEDEGCYFEEVRSSRLLNQLISDSNGNYATVTNYHRELQGNSTEVGAVRWLSEQNECEWFGIDCGDAYPEGSGAFSPLINLDLSSNNLAGALLPDSLAFSSLQGLFLDGNGNIFGTIPSEISSMSQLKYIDVDGNALTGTIPDTFFTLTNLISIDLNSNFLTGSLSEAVGDLSGLEVLQLENNSFGGDLPTDALLGLLRLVALTLEGNLFTGTLEPICDVRDERRLEYEAYLEFIFSECAGEDPLVDCSCCVCYPPSS